MPLIVQQKYTYSFSVRNALHGKIRYCTKYTVLTHEQHIIAYVQHISPTIKMFQYIKTPIKRRMNTLQQLIAYSCDER